MSKTRPNFGSYLSVTDEMYAELKIAAKFHKVPMTEIMYRSLRNLVRNKKKHWPKLIEKLKKQVEEAEKSNES